MKKLAVNAAVCDVRNVTEETLSAYDKVRINAATVLTSPAAQVLLSKYAVSVNAAKTLSLEGDVRVSSVNGPMSIHPGQAMPEEKVFLLVNAPLEIAPGSEEILSRYAGMVINGPVTCPESMTGLLSAFKINGPVLAYPDGSIVLKRTTVLERTFSLRVRQDACYYAAKRVVALAKDIDFGKLAEKNVRFITKQLLVAESLAEAAVPLFDEKTDIVVLPDGCAYVDGSVELDEALLKRYGGRLYVNGDVTVMPASAPLLDRIAYLHAKDLLVCRSLKDRVAELAWEYDSLYPVGSTLITGRAKVELNAGTLERSEEGVSVIDCANVFIAEDVTAELIREKLAGISDCAHVYCAGREQLLAAEPLTRDVATVALAKDACESGADEAEEDEDVVRINSASCVL